MYAGAHTLRIHVSNGCGIAGVPGSRTSHAPGARASCALSVQTRSRSRVPSGVRSATPNQSASPLSATSPPMARPRSACAHDARVEWHRQHGEKSGAKRATTQAAIMPILRTMCIIWPTTTVSITG